MSSPPTHPDTHIHPHPHSSTPRTCYDIIMSSLPTHPDTYKHTHTSIHTHIHSHPHPTPTYTTLTPPPPPPPHTHTSHLHIPPTPTTRGLLFQPLLKLFVLFLQLLLLPLPLLRHLVHQHLHLDQLLLQHQHIVSTRPGRNRGKEVIQATANKMKFSFFTFCSYTLLASTL